MLFCPILIVFGLLFLETIDSETCPAQCKCTNISSAALRVDCSLRDLHEIPPIPDITEELYLEQNQIITVPPGIFDNLMNLKKLNLSSNPLYCDCKIWYLKLWLDDQKLDKDNNTKCVSPAALRGTPVSQLVAGRHFTSCSAPQRHCSDFLLNDLFLYGSLFLLFFLMILCLKTVRVVKFKVKVTEHDIKFQMRRTMQISSLKRRLNLCK
ncbi:platelet glycoprotein IX-like [Pelodytes ibericus]